MNVETDYSGVPAYANGTSNASGGVSLVGEKGAELRVMNRGDGVIPANATQNLLRMAQNPSQFVTNSNKSTTLQFSGNMSFPNIKNETDAKGFVSALLAIGNNGVAKFN
jgi:phage-related tail protein